MSGRSPDGRPRARGHPLWQTCANASVRPASGSRPTRQRWPTSRSSPARRTGLAGCAGPIGTSTQRVCPRAQGTASHRGGRRQPGGSSDGQAGKDEGGHQAGAEPDEACATAQGGRRKAIRSSKRSRRPSPRTASRRPPRSRTWALGAKSGAFLRSAASVAEVGLIGARGRPVALVGERRGGRDYSRNSAACTQREGAVFREGGVHVWVPRSASRAPLVELHDRQSTARLPRSNGAPPAASGIERWNLRNAHAGHPGEFADSRTQIWPQQHGSGSLGDQVDLLSGQFPAE